MARRFDVLQSLLFSLILRFYMYIIGYTRLFFIRNRLKETDHGNCEKIRNPAWDMRKIKKLKFLEIKKLLG